MKYRGLNSACGWERNFATCFVTTEKCYQLFRALLNLQTRNFSLNYHCSLLVRTLLSLDNRDCYEDQSEQVRDQTLTKETSPVVHLEEILRQ